MTGKSPVDAFSEGSPVIRWLMTEGRHITDAKSFLECFAARLRDARVDVSRITTGVPVLHPQLFSVSSLWERGEAVAERRYRVDPSQVPPDAPEALHFCSRRQTGRWQLLLRTPANAPRSAAPAVNVAAEPADSPPLSAMNALPSKTTYREYYE